MSTPDPLCAHERERPHRAGPLGGLYDRCRSVRDARHHDATATHVCRYAERCAGRRSHPAGHAMLGIVWNVGAMVVYAARDFDISHSLPWVAAVSYTALGFLPAVVVHSTVRRSSPMKHRWYVGDRVCRQRRRRRPASRRRRSRHDAVVVRSVAPHDHLCRAARRACRHRATPPRVSAKYYRGGAGGVCGVRAASESTRRRRRPRSVVDGAHRTSRVTAARVGDPLSRLSIRVCGSLPQARAVVARARSSSCRCCMPHSPRRSSIRTPCSPGARSTAAPTCSPPRRSSRSGS